MSESAATAAVWSYALALAGYLAFAIRVALGSRRSARAELLLGATLATALWAGGGLAIALQESRGAWLVVKSADALRYGLWFAFVWSLLKGAQRTHSPSDAEAVFPWWTVALVAGGLVASVALAEELPLAQWFDLTGRRIELGIHIGLAVGALVLVEQLMRRAHAQSRWAIKPLGIALAGTFGFDLFFYADAMLFSRIDPDIWVARAIANVIVIPLIALATARNTGWKVEMHLSREAVFQSTALLGSGALLLAIAAAGYLARYLVGDWGRALQIELLFAAVLSVVLVASSGRFRSKLKVFVSKHFFSYRYDYRAEWLRFSRTLSGEGSIQGIQERVIMALADFVESPAGALWLKEEGRGFVPAARWNMPPIDAVASPNDPLALFLEHTGWIVNLKELGATPAAYPDLAAPAWLASIPDAWLVIPLASGTDLLGFVVLATPRAMVKIDWEVHDLLKTASQQAASYLGQLRATEALLEARKFDAFNRMSAFIVHDLKNLVAQLSLMLKNSTRHSTNPEFQRDMLTTVQNAVERMNRLMLQLRTSANPVENPRPVQLEPLVRRVCAAKTGHREPVAVDFSPGLVALGDEDRLEHVIGHLVQNALDATIDGGSVSLRLGRNGRFAVIEVADTGVGMTPEFVRERLFKPFETTKATGMGIGVYESSQYITRLGGQILVESTPRVGTRVRVLLPLGDDTAPSPATIKEVA
ncbi:MAG TPA: XrtA/PEP-CTERM system histidine kinase PrsK [Casimicrobiaceae bacterium]